MDTPKYMYRLQQASQESAAAVRIAKNLNRAQARDASLAWNGKSKWACVLYERASYYASRVEALRSEARHIHLALAYLRGTPYRDCERVCHTKPDAKKIFSRSTLAVPVIDALRIAPVASVEKIVAWLEAPAVAKAPRHEPVVAEPQHVLQ